LASQEITRRQLLAAGLAGAGQVVLGGCSPAERLAYDADVCVIGSGFAGLPLAMRCVERGLRTVVVEAGRKNAASFTYSNSGRVDYPIGASRMIGLGGASGHWGGVVTRLSPDDFAVRSKHGGAVDWPLSYEDLESYYCEAESFLGVEGSAADPTLLPARSCDYPQPARKPYPGFGLDLDDTRLSFFSLPMSRRRGGPVRLKTEEVPRFAAQPGASLLSDRRVTALISEDGSSIDRIEMGSNDGLTSTLRARVFVLAAGVVESARLLLASRSTWHPEGIGNERGLVGRYFTYHPLHFATFEASGSERVPMGANRSQSLDPIFRAKGLNACQIQVNRGRDRTGRLQNPLGVWLSPETEPNAENRLTLSETERDAFGMPIPDLRFTHTPRDEETLSHARQVGEAIREQFGGDAPLVYRQRIHGHPAGPCRMGFDASNGVVDRDSRVFGVDNLYVSGASVFPISGATNPTGTVVALSLRLADHLMGRYAS
jgi:choline dehydrogenase-like flavoprotein